MKRNAHTEGTLRATVLDELEKAIKALEAGKITAYKNHKNRAEKACLQLAETESIQ